MGEYNLQYINCKKQLNLRKLLVENLPDSPEKTVKLLMIDGMLKDLDERYSDGRQLNSIEYDLEKIMN